MGCRCRPAVQAGEFLVAGGRGHQDEGLRTLLREDGVSFLRLCRAFNGQRSGKPPWTPCEAKKARIEHLYAIADDEVVPERANRR
jgi:hypothetical protein